MRLTTTRPANLNGLATQLFTNAGTVQDLHYTYVSVARALRSPSLNWTRPLI